MTKITPFSAKNKKFTDTAHTAAKRDIYPLLFGDNIEYENQQSVHKSERWHVLDGSLGIDQVLSVTRKGFRGSFTVTVQERFRETKWEQMQDLTITEWNKASDTPSELYKIAAHYFVYGYYDDKRDMFTDWLCINTASMMRGIMSGKLPYAGGATNERSGQPFITVKFDDLIEYGCVVMRVSKSRSVIPDELGFAWLASLSAERVLRAIVHLSSMLTGKNKKDAA